jgi:transposase
VLNQNSQKKVDILKKGKKPNPKGRPFYMSTSTLYHAFQIDGVKYKSTSYEESALIFNAEMSEKYLYCPRCKSRDISFKGQKKRKFHLPPIGGKKCFLTLKMHRFHCANCYQISWPHLPFMKGKSRMSRSFIRLALDLLSLGTIKSVANFLKVGWDCIKAPYWWTQRHLQITRAKKDKPLLFIKPNIKGACHDKVYKIFQNNTS